MTVLIVDGNNLAHRCRHVFSLSYQGYDTSVTYGVLSVLHSVMLKHAPEAVIVCWDGGIPQFRMRYCPTYKQHRNHDDDPTYDEFLDQVRELQDTLPMFGVCSVRRHEVEADDLMYQAALMLSGDKILMTSDQDLYQAVVTLTDTVVYSPSRDEIIGPANFEELTGVRPDWNWWMTYRALVGDSSDGIPGASQIGHKRALQLLERYGGSHTAMINDALNPGTVEGPTMSISMSNNLGMFGHQGFTRSYATMRLDKDRCGARRELLRAFSGWQSYSHKDVKQFLMAYNMLSLEQPEFYRAFRSLGSPESHLIGGIGTSLRIPAIAPSRQATECLDDS